MNKLIETGIKGLQVCCGDDGVWLYFNSDGKAAGINMNVYAEEYCGRITNEIINAWCKQTLEREEAVDQIFELQASKEQK